MQSGAPHSSDFCGVMDSHRSEKWVWMSTMTVNISLCKYSGGTHPRESRKSYIAQEKLPFCNTIENLSRETMGISLPVLPPLHQHLRWGSDLGAVFVCGVKLSMENWTASYPFWFRWGHGVDQKGANEQKAGGLRQEICLNICLDFTQ